MNQHELHASQSWLRRLMLRWYELPAFVAMLDSAAIDLRGKRILDAGCGAGSALRLLHQRFRPSTLVGFDLMPEQVSHARRAAPFAVVSVGDVTAIEAKDGSFDAVFVFGVLHHVPEWKVGLAEIARVLAPGGVLLLEELQGKAVDFEDRFFKTSHPHAARFDWETLKAGIAEAGFEIVRERPVACCTPIRWPLVNGARSFLCRRPSAPGERT